MTKKHASRSLEVEALAEMRMFIARDGSIRRAGRAEPWDEEELRLRSLASPRFG